MTLVQNIKRDPFEQAVGIDQKSAMGLGGALAAPSTAYLYDWNMLPIGQQLWLEGTRDRTRRSRRCRLRRPTTWMGSCAMVKKAQASGHPSD